MFNICFGYEVYSKAYYSLSAENLEENREVSSPLPDGAENIRRDMPEVWEHVFGTSDVSVSVQKSLNSVESSTPKITSSDNEASKTSLLHAPENSPILNQKFSPETVNDVEVPILSSAIAEPIVGYCNNAEIPSKDSELTALTPANINELTPFALEVPSSFENSPAISFGDLPSILSRNIPTPIPSPINSHKDCLDSFCSIHDSEHWTQSPSIATASSAPYDSSNDERSTPPKKKLKKRIRRTSEWSDVKRKCLKNIGKGYVTKRGKVVDDKILGKPCACRNRCHKKISHDQRYDCFQKFWCLGSREKQWAFVVNYTKKEPKRRCLNRDIPNNRRFTYKYFLPLKDANSEEFQTDTASVCKTMFLNTLSVSGKIIKTAWGKI